MKQPKLIKYYISVPVKPAPNIYIILKSDAVKINITETSGIYRFECNKGNKTGCYIGLYI